MPTASPVPVQAVAPHLAFDVACRVGLIVAGLAALVAAGLLHHPHFQPLIIPLWTRITRAGRRFERLMARVAANRLPKPRPPRPDRQHPDAAHAPARPAAPALPTGHGWLVRVLGWQAAGYMCQLDHLLAEPGVAELFAACPGARRILSPLGRMLGLAAFAPKPRIRKPRARTPPQPTAPADPPGAAASPGAPPYPVLPPSHPAAGYRPSAHWPAGCRRRATPA